MNLKCHSDKPIVYYLDSSKNVSKIVISESEDEMKVVIDEAFFNRYANGRLDDIQDSEIEIGVPEIVANGTEASPAIKDAYVGVDASTTLRPDRTGFLKVLDHNVKLAKTVNTEFILGGFFIFTLVFLGTSLYFYSRINDKRTITKRQRLVKYAQILFVQTAILMVLGTSYETYNYLKGIDSKNGMSYILKQSSLQLIKGNLGHRH